MSDGLRPKSSRVVTRLRALEVGRIVPLTGDRLAAATISLALRRNAVLADQSPTDEINAVRAEAAAALTAMVGDGVSDAPTLAATDVGIAMIPAGTAGAAEAVHVVLLVDRMDRVAEAIGIAQIPRRIALMAIAIGMELSLTL